MMNYVITVIKYGVATVINRSLFKDKHNEALVLDKISNIDALFNGKPDYQHLPNANSQVHILHLHNIYKYEYTYCLIKSEYTKINNHLL